MRFLHYSVVAVSLLALSGCAATDKLFGEPVEPPLPGERISVLELQRDLEPDPALAEQQMYLPDVWTNKFWPQAGGYPTHSMGHLGLGQDLKKVWTASIGEGGSDRRPLMASPVVAEGLVFTLDTEGYVSAFNLQSGDRKWRRSVIPRGEEEAGAIGGGLAYAGAKLYVTNGYKQVVAIHPDNGGLIWKAETSAPARAAPAVYEDRVFVMTLDNKLQVFHTDTGESLWTHTGLTETTNLLGTASPAADRSMVVVPMSSGELYGLRTENGRLIWEDNLSAVRRAGALSSIADIRGLPVIDKGIVYAISFSGRMIAIDQISGRRIWQREIGGSEMPWAAGDSVFVITSDQQLVALTRESGGIRWIVELQRWENERTKEGPIVWTGPVLAGDRLITVSSTGRVMEVDPATGGTVRTWKTDESIIAPVVADKTLLILTRSGELMAYR